MSNDKTLATAKPGGCVQLKDFPSPGGQGNALDCIGRIEEAIEFRVPHDIYAAVHGELTELKAALAARQPVGEAVCNVEGTWLWSKFMDWCKRMGAAPSSHNELFAIAKEAHALYTAPTAQAVDLGQFREAVEMAMEAPLNSIQRARLERLLALIYSHSEVQ